MSATGITHRELEELLRQAESKTAYLSMLLGLLERNQDESVSTMAVVVGAQVRELLLLLTQRGQA